jgi:2,3-dihydroxybenzoate decarboxylase
LSDAAGELRGQIAAYWKPHAIACAARLGIADAMDYPYQYVPEEVVWMDDLDITDVQKKKFFQTNAERWFKL